ncbi:MAG: GNAT family N-acetyltransferase [Lachnospiraceae bacterium]|nr:GNAT family N-acetyltransferase [Lachnospiraceae bacterium]
MGTLTKDICLRYLILALKDIAYPYLDRTLADVKLSGIELVPIVVSGNDTEAGDGKSGHMLVLDEQKLREALSDDNRKCSYFLTDCMEGIDLAVQYKTGYVFYDTDVRDIPYTTDGDRGPQCIIQGFDEINADFFIKMHQRFNRLPWTVLTTERLLLREMTPEDVDRLYEIYAGEGITRYTEPLYEDKQQEIEYTKEYIKNMYEFCGYGLWLVVEKDTGRIVGRAGITGREGFDEAELGYVIEKERQRRGYAAEACRAIVDYAGKVLGMKGLNCFVYPENIPSVKLCKLIGFEYMENTVINGTEMHRYHLALNK